MESTMLAQRAPRSFRRRMLAATLAAGLAPVLIWGLASEAALDRFLGLSLAPVDQLLDRLDARLPPAEAELRGEVERAQLYLAQAELARRSLARRLPQALAVMLIASAATLAAAALLLGRALGAPLARLTEGMLHLARGDLEQQ